MERSTTSDREINYKRTIFNGYQYVELPDGIYIYIYIIYIGHFLFNFHGGTPSSHPFCWDFPCEHHPALDEKIEVRRLGGAFLGGVGSAVHHTVMNFMGFNGKP